MPRRLLCAAWRLFESDMCATVHQQLCYRNTHSGPRPPTPIPQPPPAEEGEIFIWPLVLQEFQAF